MNSSSNWHLGWVLITAHEQINYTSQEHGFRVGKQEFFSFFFWFFYLSLIFPFHTFNLHVLCDEVINIYLSPPHPVQSSVYLHYKVIKKSSDPVETIACCCSLDQVSNQYYSSYNLSAWSPLEHWLSSSIIDIYQHAVLTLKSESMNNSPIFFC